MLHHHAVNPHRSCPSILVHARCYGIVVSLLAVFACTPVNNSAIHTLKPTAPATTPATTKLATTPATTKPATTPATTKPEAPPQRDTYSVEEFPLNGTPEDRRRNLITFLKREGQRRRTGSDRAVLPADPTHANRMPADRQENRPDPSMVTTAISIEPLQPALPHAVRVALILPLSGPNATIGNGLLNAAQLALFDFKAPDMEMMVFDSESSPQITAAVTRSAIEQGAKLIIGPVFSQSVDAARQVATQAGVPVIAFSNDVRVLGDTTYSLGITPAMEVARIIAYAHAKGARHFALLAPDNPYGMTILDALLLELVRLGNARLQYAFYREDESNLSEVVQDLAAYEERRNALMEKRLELEEQADDLSERALERLKNLETLGDLPFDALLVADGGQRLIKVGTLLPYYDIDPTVIQILGTGLMNRSGIGSEPGLTGALFAGVNQHEHAQFLERYQRLYDQAPPYVASFAYEALALASALVISQRNDPFNPKNLTDRNGFTSYNGLFRLREQGWSDRGLAVYRARKTTNLLIDPAPTNF